MPRDIRDLSATRQPISFAILNPRLSSERSADPFGLSSRPPHLMCHPERVRFSPEPRDLLSLPSGTTVATFSNQAARHRQHFAAANEPQIPRLRLIS